MSPSPEHRRVDTAALLSATDLVSLVGQYGVKLRRTGSEYEGLCPFHEERTPSFAVNPAKQFVHCFGCGAHHDAIGFVMAMTGKPFREACEQLWPGEGSPIAAPMQRARRLLPAGVWIPMREVPAEAPPLLDGAGRAKLWNPKKGRFWTCEPSRADEYRGAGGQLLGYVLRVEMSDGKKITPQVTWCIAPDGAMLWCVRPFSLPRPLCGLDALTDVIATIEGPVGTRKRRLRAGEVYDLDAGECVSATEPLPVLVVEGEKCRAAGADALRPYAVVTWPGGSKGVRHVDWLPLAGRDIVLWPDADPAGREAMLGREDASGRLFDGVAQLAWRAGARSLRLVDPEGQPRGWDIADALQLDGWTPRQLAAWAGTRVVELDVHLDARRRAA